MRTNRPAVSSVRTYEGAVAVRQASVRELERTVASCLLFEDNFYEGGNSLAKRIETLCDTVRPEVIAGLAVKARKEYHLRHVSLFLCVQLTRRATGRLVGDTIQFVISRADELSEFLAMYWKNGRRPLPAQVKRGLALAFNKFDAYNLSKYNRDDAVKLRDVMFLVHPKPLNRIQERTWKKLVNGNLPVADTWETALSAGADKRETWSRLLREDGLGYLALLRNLRNMEEAGVQRSLVVSSLLNKNSNGVLPSQFVAAYRNAPSHAEAIEAAFLQSSGWTQTLRGHTALLIDVSGSMGQQLSSRSQINRLDAASSLAMLFREVCESVRVFTFSDRLVEVPNLRGFGLMESIYRSQAHNSTMLGRATAGLRTKGVFQRVIVVTDEQTQDGIAPAFAPQSYVVNCAPYQYGIGDYHGWTQINGLSDKVVEWVKNEENIDSQAETPWTMDGAEVELPVKDRGRASRRY